MGEPGGEGLDLCRDRLATGRSLRSPRWFDHLGETEQPLDEIDVPGPRCRGVGEEDRVVAEVAALELGPGPGLDPDVGDETIDCGPPAPPRIPSLPGVLVGLGWVGTYDGAVHLSPLGNGFAVGRIDCPVPGATIAVATDGTVWIGGDGWMRAEGLAHITAAGCALVDPRQVQSIDADPDGAVVVALEAGAEFKSDATAIATVESFAGGRWTALGSAPALAGSSLVAVSPTGEIWWVLADPVVEARGLGAGSGGLVHLEGGTWSRIVSGGHDWGPVSVSPDGRLWLAGPTGIYRIAPGRLP